MVNDNTKEPQEGGGSIQQRIGRVGHRCPEYGVKMFDDQTCSNMVNTIPRGFHVLKLFIITGDRRHSHP